MERRITALVFGMTRTIKHFSFAEVSLLSLSLLYRASCKAVSVTPAQMLMSSFPFKASLIPGSLRTSTAFKGLQPIITTSAALTPERLSFCRIERRWLKGLSLDWIRAEDWGLVTQAMKLEGRWVGFVVVNGGASLWRAEKMPERMAVPRVPVFLCGVRDGAYGEYVNEDYRIQVL